jgi:glucosyl-3-phosphoglycerate synthase
LAFATRAPRTAPATGEQSTPPAEAAPSIPQVTTRAPWTLSAGELDGARALAMKGDETVSVVVPVQNESATIGSVLDAVLAPRGEGPGLVDEVLVVNDHSRDDSATVAERHGARVVSLEGPSGKGEAMNLGLAATTGSIVVFLDGDVTTTSPDYVPRLVQPLLERPAIQLVKGFYERPFQNQPTGGGRVTELAARPILGLLFPGLGEVRQPLAGETAGRRETFAAFGFAPGYGVEIALLIDVAQKYGADAVAQVDLGLRRHRNRPIEELGPMAVEVLRAALTRFGVEPPTR